MRDHYSHETIHVRFRYKDCDCCPSRSLCSRAKKEPRELPLRLQAEHVTLQMARRWQQTEAFKEEYAKDAGIEGTI